MGLVDKAGSLAWTFDKLKTAYEWGDIAVNAADPATRENAGYQSATKVAEAVGIGIPLYYVDKALTKTGLDRVFDSLKKNKGFEEYLKRQGALGNIRDVGLGALAEWGLDELRNWMSERQMLDPLFDIMTGEWSAAKRWIQPRDPIIVDLNGNGLETVGLAANIYFDHDGDGVRSGTGWVGKNDALLVWDRNANGRIETGAELFGDFTPLPNGTLAANGFAALSALDSNGDGILDASDPAFAELKLWRDSSQDGVTGSGELLSLADVGITSLNLNSTIKNQALPNGNMLSREGSFTRADGTKGAVGEFKLAIDTFHSQFTEQIAVPDALKGLPFMSGSGNVRDIQQAAAQSDKLASLLAQYKSAPTRAEQRVLLDKLVTAWADTSGMAKSLEERTLGKYRVQYDAFGSERRSANLINNQTVWTVKLNGPVRQGGSYTKDASPEEDILTDSYQKLITEWTRKLHVLEAFNGQYFFNLPDEKSQTPTANWGMTVIGVVNNGGSGTASFTVPDFLKTQTLSINFSQAQLNSLQRSYDSLLERLDSSLAVQTRLKPYLDLLDIVGSNDDIYIDATLLNEKLNEKKELDPESYLADLLDLQRYAGKHLSETNWIGLANFDTVLENLPRTPNLTALLKEHNIRELGSGDDVQSHNRAAITLAGEGNDTLYGSNDDDRLFGQAGNDRLYGGEGNDLISGGAGDDLLSGSAGADTYVFGRGYGHDVISDFMENGVRRDAVRFLGLNPADIQVSTDASDSLIFTIRQTGETLKIPAKDIWLQQDGVGMYVFEDGTVWSHNDALRASVALPTDQDDVIYGSSAGETIRGLAGNDTLIGGAGDDVLDGGAGDDTLIGSSPWRSPTSTAAYNGSDTYLFGRGDGRDTIIDVNWGASTDTLRFKAGITVQDLKFRRNGSDLVVSIRGTADQVTLKRYFLQTWDGNASAYVIEQMAFEDGTVLTVDDVQKRLLSGNEDAEYLIGSSGDDVITGQGGDDIIFGGRGHDVMDGGAGNDTLIGNFAPQELAPYATSESGFDGFHSSSEGDVYRFGRGDGHDIIDDFDFDGFGKDRIEFKAGIKPEDVRLERVSWTPGTPAGFFGAYGDDLKITIRDTGESLTVKAYFTFFYADHGTAGGVIEEIAFQDGTVWDLEAVKTRILLGESGDDVIRGFNGRADVLRGGAGNDSLSGLSGDDVLVGGTGNDVLAGGDGADSYQFGLGDGNDVIQEGESAGDDVLELGSGIRPDDVTLRWTGAFGSLVVTLPDGSRISIDGQDSYSQQRGIEQLRFADGTVWDRSEMIARAIQSTAGDDVIAGSHANDEFDGSTGNDYFYSEGGVDTIHFGIGDGHDVIDGIRGRVAFKTGIDQNGVAFSVDGPDLIATIKSSGDSIRIKNWITDRRVSAFVFENGAMLMDQQVLALLGVNDSTEILYGSPGDDVLASSGRNTTIIAGEGNDTLVGGQGRDTLYGEAGNDVLEGGADRDWLYGGEGNNTYLMSKGMGLDYAVGSDGAVAQDTIAFAAGIRPEDVSIQIGYPMAGSQPGDIGYRQLIIGIGGNDALIIRAGDLLDLARGAIQRFLFADGTTWSLADAVAHADGGKMEYISRSVGDPLAILGSQMDDQISDDTDQSITVQARGNNDSIHIGAGNDLVSAGTGDDYVGAGAGNDVVAGEAGRDFIDAAEGDDVILFNYGDGEDTLGAGTGIDTLSLGVTIAPNMLTLYRNSDGQTVLLVDAGKGGQIALAGGLSDLERLQFVDASGQFRVFDLAGWLKANEALMAATSAQRTVQFSGAGHELTGRVALAGGKQAIAYAQTNDLFGNASTGSNQAADGNDTLYGTAAADTLHGLAGNDQVLGLEGDDVLFGDQGNDLLSGGAGVDVLDGGLGDDILYGDAGTDQLTGGGGHDELYGGQGGDTYLFRAGDGSVIIDDGHAVLRMPGGDGIGEVVWDQAPNILQFGAGIRREDLRFSEVSGDLLITIAGNVVDTITLRGYDSSRATKSRSVDIIRFADGSELVETQIKPEGVVGSLGHSGGMISGSSLADTLVGGDGDDTFDGQSGSDFLAGGLGSDTYIIQKKPGASPAEVRIAEIWQAQDINRVQISGAVNPADLRLEFDGHDLLLRYTQDGDRVRFMGFDPRMTGMKAPVSEVIVEGETLTFSDLLSRGVKIVGTPGADNLTGTALSDWIEGLEGNDVLAGGEGADIYVIAAHNGSDEIIDRETGGAPNTLVLPDSVTPASLKLSYRTDGYLILNLDGAGNRVLLAGFDPANPLGTHAIERFRFGLTGNEISYAELLTRGFDIDGTAGSDNLKGTALADRITAGDGNDLLEATAGGDKLYGQGGDDTYVVKIGNGEVFLDDVATSDAGNVLRFGPGITQTSLKNNLRFASDQNGRYVLDIAYGNSGDVVHLSGFDPNNVLGTHAVERFEFSDGTSVDYATLVSWTFVSEGTNAANAVSGTNVNDRLYGYDGEDLLSSGDGMDVLTGGAGNDELIGGSKRDAYVFNLGDGEDIIRDGIENGQGNTITFGKGISRDGIHLSQEGADLVVRYGTGSDFVRVKDFAPNGRNAGTVIDTFEFDDGTAVTLREFMNHAPVVSETIADQVALEDSAFALRIPDHLFIDADGDEVLSKVTVSGFKTLPSWLNYDVQSRMLYGTPTNGDVGEFDVIIQGYDPLGANALYGFHVVVQNVNDAPEVNKQLASIRAQEDSAFTFVIPADSFKDIDVGDALAYSVSLADGSPLPAWLKFDPASRTLTGMPSNGEVGAIRLKVTAADRSAATSSQEFALEVVNINDAPKAGGALAVQVATEDTPFRFTIPSDAFSDDDQGDKLHFVATLADGKPLPNWLVFDGERGTFTGMPQNGDVGELLIQIQAIDMAGERATQVVTIRVNNTNDAPVVTQPIQRLTATEDALFTFTVPTNSFFDADVGDSLTYSMSGPNGASLPAWLRFDAVTRTFSGVPSNSDVGTINVLLTATDRSGASASQTVTIDVANVNDAPTVGVKLSDQSSAVGSGLSWQLPNGAFADVDKDDVLTLTATQADGTALPSWLVFDGRTGTFSGTPPAAAVFSIKVTASDRAGAQVSQVFSATINGTTGNQAPVTAPDSETLIEDRKVFAWGNVLSNDHDPEGKRLKLADPGIRRGEYGILTMLSDGTYAYVLDNCSAKVQGLGAGEFATEKFSYLASDGQKTSKGELSITVQGTNDIPVLMHCLSDVQLAKGKAFKWKIPSGTFADQDRNDHLSYMATLSNGAPLPTWLKFDGITQTFSGQAPVNARGGIEVKVTVSDGEGACSTAYDAFRIDFGNRTIVPAETAGKPVQRPHEDWFDSLWDDFRPTVVSNDSFIGRADIARLIQSSDNAGFTDTHHGGSKAPPIPEQDWLEKWLKGTPAKDAGPGDGGRHVSRDSWAEVCRALARLDNEAAQSSTWGDSRNGASLTGLSPFASTNGQHARASSDAISLTDGEVGKLKAFSGIREGFGKLPW